MAWAAEMKASVMAKLFPFLRGLPVTTTIFLFMIIFLKLDDVVVFQLLPE